jgi:2,4-dienoyl-CoA reductase-like NADH-dependent reductase (Old Yellow Enzyme family)/thioredoxin reductase
MSSYQNLFTPLKIGRITVKNRIEFPPVGPHLGTSDGYVSRELIEWGRQFARGGAGIVTLGDSAVVAPAAARASYAVHVGTEKSINPLNRFAETIRRYGAKASIQLNYHSRCSPTEMGIDEIKLMIESYAQAAYRCWLAGMDMVMVHGAHGHILSQFVSARTNARTDEFGGSLENRARLAGAVLEAIRNRVGDKLAIEYRISADEMVPGAPTVEEQLEFAKLIEDKIDLIQVSAANLFAPETMPMMIQPTYFPRGLNLKYALLFKNHLKIPVATVGSYNLEMAGEIINENKADMVAMARSLIADPDSVNKERTGCQAQIRPCLRCNHCFNRSHFQMLTTRCTVNPVIGWEAEFINQLPPVKKKKVVVAGGGPAGMEAARKAAERGHEVALLEKSTRLGGTLELAAAFPFKADMKKYLDWAVRATLDTRHLSVRLSTAATPANIRVESPDVLIIATGSAPVIPRIPGVDNKNVAWAGDVIAGKAITGNQVLVAGAGLTGSETALWLAQQGKRVTLIDVLSLEQIDAEYSVINIQTLRKMLGEAGVKTITGVKLEATTGKGATIAGKDGKQGLMPCDTVVLALGVEPRRDTVEAIKDLAPEVYTVGDCHNPRGNLSDAISDGFFTAVQI